MSDFALDEDPIEEFKGGTLAISDNKPTETLIKTISPDKVDNQNDNELLKSNNDKKKQWGISVISPLASIPNKITQSLWKKDKTSPEAPSGNTSIQPALCVIENPNNYFTYREEVIAKALAECKEQFLDDESDGPLISAFLLTQISNWNSDKERLVLLTPQILVVVKYDFIALKRLAYRKLPLELVDQVIIGELTYPNGSLIPRINGLVDGLSNVLETCLFARSNKTDNKLVQFYQPRNRNMKGVRLVWNKGKNAHFSSQWNPFNEDLPFFTFTFHPLFFNKDCEDENMKNLYNLDAFAEKLTTIISDVRNETEIISKEIMLENYIGIGSVIHNRNSLGFFKVRGKFSF